jgi:8-oxo-dGTP diphosphatase
MAHTGAPGRREVALGLIVSPDGRLLMQLRDDRPDVPGAGRWGFFGGHMEQDERPSAAFLREIKEEVGWAPRHFEHFATREVDADDIHWLTHVFAAHLDVPLEGLTLGEGQRMELFAPDALPPPERQFGATGEVIREFVASPAYARMRRRHDGIFTAGLLVDADGRLLLQLRDDKPDIVNPGVWGTFGGLLEPFETPEEGFLRELDEELCWQPASCELHLALAFDRGGEQWLIYAFAAPVDVPLGRMELREGQDLAFFAPDALPERIAPVLPRLLRAFADSAQYRAMMTVALRQER